MEVEVYVGEEMPIEPVKARIYEEQIFKLGKGIEVCEDLGLSGQVKVLTQEEKAIEHRRSTPPQYRPLTDQQKTILFHYFNVGVDVRYYEAEAIPGPVVDIYKGANYFKTVDVRTHREVRFDPILVGEGLSGSFLLARWGDALKPWQWFLRRYFWRDMIDQCGLPVIKWLGSLFLLFVLGQLFAGCVPGGDFWHARLGKDTTTLQWIVLFLPLTIAHCLTVGLMWRNWRRYLRIPSPFKE